MSKEKPHIDLPPDVTWDYNERYGQLWLMVGNYPVANISQRVSMDFLVLVNRHLGFEVNLTGGAVATRSLGKKMAERWLRANYSRVKREIEQLRSKRR